jgi:uncharacterized protein
MIKYRLNAEKGINSIKVKISIMPLSEKGGQLAVGIARRVVDTLIFEGRRYEPDNVPPSFNEKRGVFVTLEKYPSHDLRGCIGFPEPVAPLIDALIDSAISAASRDPRFRPVDENELDKLLVEVSVLTPPELIKVNDPRELPNKIKVGRDGLIMRRGWASGLLLPQVPVEWGWDEEEFLSQACRKAGLPSDAWLDPETEVYSFQGQVWCEEKPRGKIARKEM